MSEKVESSEKIKIEDKRSPDYKSHFVTNVFGGLTPEDGKIVFIRDEVMLKTNLEGVIKIGEVNREYLSEIHLTPSQFKRIALWMNENVIQYEKIFGEIPIERGATVKSTTAKKEESTT